MRRNPACPPSVFSVVHLFLILCLAMPAFAGEAALPRDARETFVRNTDTVYMMPEYRTKEEWEKKADQIRRRILLGCGLFPLPDKTPLNAKVFDKIEHEDYTVEKVHFEARPGFLVTGNLYRPKKAGPYPGVICPHGHWKNGRLEDSNDCSVPGRCITLARMGIAAFTYDMLGYNDSKQFQHRWTDERLKLWGIHPFSLQLWSSIRALDFMESLPDIDKSRLGCTGASGGGTQTFALYAVDPRVKCAVPVNMISSTMQGGCVCENAPLMRLDCSNMEIGAMMAPRPLLMVAATGDWTAETPRVEYPAIKSIYKLYGAEAKVEMFQIEAGHNYNKLSREAMYRFMGKHLLGDKDYSTFTEPPFTKDPDEALRVFPGDQPPAGYPTKDQIIEQIIADSKAKWEKFAKEYPEQITSQLITDITGAYAPDVNELACERKGIEKIGNYVVEKWVLGRKGAGDRIPALLYHGKGGDSKCATLFVHEKGKSYFTEADGAPGPLMKAALDEGQAVLAIDTFLSGDHASPTANAQRSSGGAFDDTFMPTNLGYRVQDVLSSLAFLHARRDLSGNIALHGVGDGAMWCKFAAAIDSRAALAGETGSVQASDESIWREKYYLPSVLSIGGIPSK